MPVTVSQSDSQPVPSGRFSDTSLVGTCRKLVHPQARLLGVRHTRLLHLVAYALAVAVANAYAIVALAWDSTRGWLSMALSCCTVLLVFM